MNLRSFTMTCVATLAVAMAASAAGQSPAAFPARPVTLVVPFTASSGSDIIARIISPKLAAKWGQPVVVDNKPGARLAEASFAFAVNPAVASPARSPTSSGARSR